MNSRQDREVVLQALMGGGQFGVTIDREFMSGLEGSDMGNDRR